MEFDLLCTINSTTTLVYYEKMKVLVALIFLTWGSNLGFLNYRQILYHLSHQRAH